MKVPPPIIEGERVRLRPVKAEDAEGVFAYASDPEVCQYTIWSQKSREDVQRHLADIIGRYAAGEAVIVDWSIERIQDGEFLGKVSLHHPEEDSVRFGLVLARKFWGMGYGTEASRLVMKAAFEEYGFRRVIGACDPRNERSHRLLESLGMNILHQSHVLELREGVFRNMLVYEKCYE